MDNDEISLIRLTLRAKNPFQNISKIAKNLVDCEKNGRFWSEWKTDGCDKMIISVVEWSWEPWREIECTNTILTMKPKLTVVLVILFCWIHMIFIVYYLSRKSYYYYLEQGCKTQISWWAKKMLTTHLRARLVKFFSILHSIDIKNLAKCT